MNQHCTILIVDDEPANLGVLKNILDDEFRLLFSKDGPKAIELAKKNQPDLILLDIMMPEMDGYEVCSRLKADFTTSRIPVIFVTAMSDIEDEARGFMVRLCRRDAKARGLNGGGKEPRFQPSPRTGAKNREAPQLSEL